MLKLGAQLEPTSFTGMASESRLETVLAADITVVDPGWLLIGRQVPTAFGKFIDLLAIDAEGQLIVIELKKNRTPREVVAQLLDYGSWVRNLVSGPQKSRTFRWLQHIATQCFRGW
ncbi:MAG: DUF91 domain-containing protein [Phycisphaeraceae bacterium]|nr:MAG: DUF91 domain-containing protein [Phycisphaeraceae bacterium]